MILVTDIGNTTIALTVLSSDFSLLFEEKIPTETGRDEERFIKAALERLRGHGLTTGAAGVRGERFHFLFDADSDTAAKDRSCARDGCSAFRAAAVSSVVPACTPAAVRLAEMLCGMPPVLISCDCDTGLSFNCIPSPEKVGADRIADAAWAASCHPLPVMTVDMGTATTINVVSENREFLGGMIGAGVWTSLRALGVGTAQLPDIAPGSVRREDLIGRHTAGCMLSASVVGTAAMVDGLAGLVEESLGLEAGKLSLILTGGNAPFVSEWIRHPFIYEPHLAAKGSALIALRNRRENL